MGMRTRIVSVGDSSFIRSTPSTGCSLQLAAETKLEIMKTNDNNNNDIDEIR